MNWWLPLFAMMAYLLGFGLQYARVRHGCTASKMLVLVFVLIALVLHADILHLLIDDGAGQNLTWSNLLSLAMWLMMVLLLLLNLFRPVETLFLLVLPVVIISVVLAVALNGVTVNNQIKNPDNLFHILLGVLTFSMICVAGLQAIALAIQERMLKHHYQGVWTKYLPPLESMESGLFQTLLLGFILLTVVIVTSAYWFYSMLSQPFVWQKLALSLVAWLVFAILLVGRWCNGWRGKKAVYFTLAIVWLLFILYFGSKLFGVVFS